MSNGALQPISVLETHKVMVEEDRGIRRPNDLRLPGAFLRAMDLETAQEQFATLGAQAQGTQRGIWPLALTVPNRGDQISKVVPVLTTELGAKQLISRVQPVGGTFSYLEATRKVDHRLFKANLNAWLSRDTDSDMLMRVIGDNHHPEIPRLRSVLSDTYGLFDDHTLLDHVSEAIRTAEGNGISELQLKDFFQDPYGEVTRIRLLSPRPHVINGDAHMAGVEISNSECGLRAVRFAIYMWKLICLNGMVAPVSVGMKRVIHRGDAVVSKVRYAIHKALGLQGTVIHRMEDMARQDIEDLDKTVENIRVELSLTQETALGAVKMLEAPKGKLYNLYEFMQGITSYANTREPVERGMLQEKAGKLLEAKAAKLVA